MCLRFLVYLALWIDAAAHCHWIIFALYFVVAMIRVSVGLAGLAGIFFFVSGLRIEGVIAIGFAWFNLIGKGTVEPLGA
jgi:hypothetical protein